MPPILMVQAMEKKKEEEEEREEGEREKNKKDIHRQGEKEGDCM